MTRMVKQFVESCRRLITLCLVLAAVPALSAVPERNCSRYAVFDLLPGMGLKEVRKVMGGKGNHDDSGPWKFKEGTTDTYRRAGTLIYVQYDRHKSRKGTATVDMIRTYTPEEAEDEENIQASLLEMFGEPFSGLDNLMAGLVPGPAVWIDPGCNMEVTAYRRLSEWWDNAEPAICIDIRRIDDRKSVPESTVSMPARQWSTFPDSLSAANVEKGTRDEKSHAGGDVGPVPPVHRLP